ncbi:unnamed protein product [Adineta steineri]|uniref:Tetratricopeptide repeat protein n=2 Tax=Adineta steineri TaxID=433720 RepID=A0A814L8S3_9BILA|nr:unnamed protein product [Adineta steineri]
MYLEIRDNSNALVSFEKVSEIYQHILSLDDFEFADSYYNIGLVYQQMGDHMNALIFFERALNIMQQSLLETHSNLQIFGENIKSLKE